VPSFAILGFILLVNEGVKMVQHVLGNGRGRKYREIEGIAFGCTQDSHLRKGPLELVQGPGQGNGGRDFLRVIEVALT
jgi:hypothetical protein